jgi:diguanylate cyclase (GGDEF)-like protein
MRPVAHGRNIVSRGFMSTDGKRRPSRPSRGRIATAEQTQKILEPSAPSLAAEHKHAVLQVLAGPQVGAIYLLDDNRCELGRGPSCTVHLFDQGISRAHAAIVRKPDGYYLEDLGSRNGTYCQGMRLSALHRLKDGDRIGIGAQTVLRFNTQDPLEHHAAHQTLELMNRDGLTQLLNRRHFDERVAAEVAYARRHGTWLHVMLVDLDNFKPINDGEGHQAGDALLRAVARALEQMLREEDLVARYGGDEFVLCVRGIDSDGALKLGERLREGIAKAAADSVVASVRVTASIGIAALDASHADASALVAAADEQLYRAKELGRNRVEIAARK